MSTDATDHRELAEFESNVLAGLKPEAEDPVVDELQQEQNAQAAAAAPNPPPQAAKTDAKSEAEKGDVRAALRASRHAERRERERADRLERDLEALRSANPKEPDPAEDDISVALQRLEVDVPQAAVVIKQLAKRIEGLQTQSAAKETPAEPEFVPDSLPAELQDAVDDVPQLLEWQTTREGQEKWALAKATDGLLFKHPAWKDKPAAERMAEVVRRVNQELAASPATKPDAGQRPVIHDAPSRGIETLSDLRGGGMPITSQGPDFQRMKSDEEVMAALAKLG